VVLAAGDGDSVPARRALEALCGVYWYPIYVYVRRKGHGPDDAEDLTQEFFAQFIAKELLRLADRNKGRFRTFLLATLDHFLAREWSRAHRQKRGGQFTFVSLDQPSPEERYRLEPVDHETPEKKFTKQWALAVLQNALVALEKESAAAGKRAFFDEVRGVLSDDPDDGAYAGIGGRLGMTEGAVRVAVHRLRRRYGELLRDEVAQTVGSASEAEDELRHLMRVLRE
jgi:RNA polymerase sigma-70 factor (ECF subfamily)